MRISTAIIPRAASMLLAVMLSGAASAAVYPPQRQLPAQILTDFKSTPASLLQQYPSGGAQMVSRVRDLGASDPATLSGLVALLKDSATTKDQMRAIVAGLAQVARMAAQSDQAFANEIQTAIAATGNSDVIAAYQAATGDVAIAATGGAGGGGSGGGGPTGIQGLVFGGGGGSATPFGGQPVGNSAPTFTGSVSSTAVGQSNNAGQPVSP